MSQQYFDDVLRITTASLLQSLGWNSATNQSIDTLSDVFGQYLQSICRQVKRYSEFAQQTDPKIDDVLAAMSEMGICLPELEEYISDVEAHAFPRDVVNVNVPKTNTLKFPSKTDEHSQSEVDMGVEPWMPLLEVTKGSHASASGSSTAQEKRVNADNRPSTPAQLKRHKSLLEEGGSKSEMQCVMMSPMGLVVTQGSGQTPSSMLPPTTIKRTKHKLKKSKVEAAGVSETTLGKHKSKRWDDAATETDEEWQDIQDKKARKKLKKAKLAEKKAKLKLDVDRKKALKKKKELKLRAKREEKLKKEQKKRNEEKYKAKLQAKMEAKIKKKLKKEKESSKKKKCALDDNDSSVISKEKLASLAEGASPEVKPKRKGRGRPPKAPKSVERMPSPPRVVSPPGHVIEEDDGEQTAGEEFDMKQAAAPSGMSSPRVVPSPIPDTPMSPEIPTSPHDLMPTKSPERSFTEPPASPEPVQEDDNYHSTGTLESRPPSPHRGDDVRGSPVSAVEDHHSSVRASPLSGPASPVSVAASPTPAAATSLSAPASPDVGRTASPIQASPEQRTVVPLLLKLDRLPSDEDMYNDREKKRKKKKKKDKHKEKKRSREESPVASPTGAVQEIVEPLVPRIKLTLGGRTSIVARTDSEESTKKKKKKKKDKHKEEDSNHSNFTSSGLKLVIKPIRSPSSSPSPQRRPVFQPFSPRSDGESSGSDATIPFAGTPRSSPAVSPIYNPSPSPPRRIISPKRPASKSSKKKASKKVAIETKTIDIVQENVHGDSAWTCPACHHGDDGGKMIGCDKCDQWYHWACVGIAQEPTESEWYCPTCSKKLAGSKKRKKVKK